MKKKLIIFIVVAAVIGLVVWRNMDQSRGKSNKTISVQIEEVQRKSIEQIVSANGNIRPVLDVDISANVSANILNITVEEGDQVDAGQLLVILDSLQYVAAVKQSKSALNAARASQQRVKSEYKRAEKLIENKLISDQEFEALEASLKLTDAEVQQAIARLEQAQDNLQKTTLTAPMDGTVTSLRKEAGEMALGSMFQADVILTVSDLSAMEVVVNVDETDVISVKKGNAVEVEIDALPDIKLSGKVTQIAQSALATRAGISQEQVIDYEVEILIDMKTMDSRIRPGMSATANITTGMSENAVAIPIQALTARPENERSLRDEKDEDEPEEEVKSIYTKEKEKLIDVVFIAEKDTEAAGGFSFGEKKEKFIVSRRPVTVGISSANFYEVIEGLEEGEMLVVGNYKAISKELKDGSKVEKKNASRKEDSE